MSRTVRTARTANVCVQTPGDEGPRPDDPRVLLARILAPFIAEELRRILSDDWIDQTTSPLGRRRHCELARAEAFAASKEGRRWRARRADVEAYITASRTRRTTDARALALPTNDTGHGDGEDSAVRDVLDEVGLELTPQRTRKRRR